MSMLWIAIILGIVEGITEFLPISSTGHLIVTTAALQKSAPDFAGPRAEVFMIFIQLGAILSVVWEYRTRLIRVARGLGGSPDARRFVSNLAVAFLPAAVVGLLIHDFISEHLFGPTTVALALIAGAVLILVMESWPRPIRTRTVDGVDWRQALAIGFAQCLALWPGFSRSAATILGGLGVGLDRRSATEFSFFLAIPTMFAATVYDLAKNHEYLRPGDAGWLALSFVISFLVAWASIRWLLRFVATHTFRGFAYYRIVLGVLILALTARFGL